MKKLVLTLTLFAGLSANAQLPDGSIAPDFTLTDINGVSHNLYTYLNQGKTVFIDVSATWCGPCWNYHNTGALENLWINHGPTGGAGVSANTTNDVIVLFVEGDAATTSADLHGTGTNTQGNWVAGVEHPIIDPAGAAVTTFNNNYNIGYFPTIYKICPNRVITEPGQASATQLYAGVGTCPAPANQPKDVLFQSYGASTSICSPMDYTPIVKIQNYGLVSLTSASVVIKENNVVVSTGTYSGNLATYALANVTCTPIIGYNGGTLNIEVLTANDANASNNVSSVVINPSLEVTNSITLDILTDGYATETSWNIKNSSNTIVPGTTDPTLANNTNYNFTYTLPSLGCYTYNITDSYGDGITPGTINVHDSEGTTILNNDAFGTGTSVAFKVTHIMGSPALTSDVQISNNAVTICDGESITLTSSSPSGNLWSTGETTRSIVVTASGNYFVTAQGGNSTTIAVTVNPVLDMITGTITEPTCNNNTDGSVQFTGTGTGDILWNGNVESNVTLPYTISNLGVGNYTFVMTDGLCSSNTVQATISDLGATVPSVSLSGSATVCDGNTVTLTSSENTNIIWSDGQTTPSIAVTSSGSYSVTYTDINGCAGSSQVVDVVVNPLPLVSAGADANVCMGSSVVLSGNGATTYTWDNGITNGVSFPLNATQTYTVTGTDGNGCAASDDVTLTVLALPTVDGGADQSICMGQTATLSGSGASTYSWSNGASNGTPFVVSVALTYTVVGTGANGCFDTDQVSITTLALPVVNAGTDVTICLGNSVTLSGSGASTYTWSGGITNGVAFTPLVASTVTYTVTGVAANGCSKTDQLVVDVNDCLGLDETVAKQAISIYPNPSNGQFVIEGSDLLNYKQVEMLDNSGRIVSKMNVQNSVLNVNLTEVSAGTYFLVFKGENGSHTQKIQVNK